MALVNTVDPPSSGRITKPVGLIETGATRRRPSSRCPSNSGVLNHGSFARRSVLDQFTRLSDTMATGRSMS